MTPDNNYVHIHISAMCPRDNLQIKFTEVICTSPRACATEQIRRWGWSIGATLFFVPLLLKNWRVYYIFHNPTQKKKVSLNLPYSRCGSTRECMGQVASHVLSPSIIVEYALISCCTCLCPTD